MANVVTTLAGGAIVVTNVPMTGGDVPFTFQSNLMRAQLQSTPLSATWYPAATSVGSAGLGLPIAGTVQPLDLAYEDLQNQPVVFRGSNGTTVQVIEYLTKVN